MSASLPHGHSPVGRSARWGSRGSALSAQRSAAAGSVLGVAPRALSVRAVPGRPCGVRAVPQRFLPYLFICCIYLFILAGECGSRPRPRLQQQRLPLPPPPGAGGEGRRAHLLLGVTGRSAAVSDALFARVNDADVCSATPTDCRGSAAAREQLQGGEVGHSPAQRPPRTSGGLKRCCTPRAVQREHFCIVFSMCTKTPPLNRTNPSVAAAVPTRRPLSRSGTSAPDRTLFISVAKS